MDLCHCMAIVCEHLIWKRKTYCYSFLDLLQNMHVGLSISSVVHWISLIIDDHIFFIYFWFVFVVHHSGWFSIGVSPINHLLVKFSILLPFHFMVLSPLLEWSSCLCSLCPFATKRGRIWKYIAYWLSIDVIVILLRLIS